MPLGKGSSGGKKQVIGSVKIPLRTKSSPSAGHFPGHTIAEILYISLYEENPERAHEEIYALLEPVLLSDIPTPVKKALFIPVNAGMWRRVKERLIELLSALSEDARSRFCSLLAKNISLLPYSMQYTGVEGLSTKVVFDLEGLADLCPDVKKYVSVGVA